MKNYFETITMADVIKHDDKYAKEKWHLSEDSPYIQENMEKFINEIRPFYTYAEDYSSGKWDRLQIHKIRTKYGTTFIYLDHERKLWRTRQSIEEFYGGGVVD